MLHKNMKTSHHPMTRSNHQPDHTITDIVTEWQPPQTTLVWNYATLHNICVIFELWKFSVGPCVVSETITSNCQKMLYLCVCVEKEISESQLHRQQQTRWEGCYLSLGRVRCFLKMQIKGWWGIRGESLKSTKHCSAVNLHRIPHWDLHTAHLSQHLHSSLNFLG